MSDQKITKLDVVIIVISAICITVLFYLVKSYVATPASPNEHCIYKIKYLHVSGREITKRVSMTCQGFYPWHMSKHYKVPVMVLPFSDGNEVLIQGATDILSVAKIKDDEQQQ